jgi:hypothetical protein
MIPVSPMIINSSGGDRKSPSVCTISQIIPMNNIVRKTTSTMPALSPLKPGHSASFYKYCFINLMKITIRLKQQEALMQWHQYDEKPEISFPSLMAEEEHPQEESEQSSYCGNREKHSSQESLHAFEAAPPACRSP